MKRDPIFRSKYFVVLFISLYYFAIVIYPPSLFGNPSFISENNGTENKPYTIDEAILHQGEGKYWVIGYIAGCVTSSKGNIISDLDKYVNSNLALGSDPEGTVHVSVQLSAGALRNAINLKDNPGNRGMPVKIYGSLESFCSIPGMKKVTDYRLVTGPLITATPSHLNLLAGKSTKVQITGQHLSENITITSENNNIAIASASILPSNAKAMEITIRALEAGITQINFESDTIKQAIVVNSNPGSDDASLKSLKIGTETVKLSSVNFPYYPKPVPYTTTFVEVKAVPTDLNATVYSITGNDHLKIGENRITVVVKAENQSWKYYTIYLTRQCEAPVISQQPVSATVCEGSKYTIDFKVSGSDLRYQWYFEGNPISGAESKAYPIANAQVEKDYGIYYVDVKGACGSVTSDKLRLWVTRPLPDIIRLEVPEVATVGKLYKASVGGGNGYSDVTDYAWSFSNKNIQFSPSGGINNLHTTFATFAQSGTLSVSLTHVCGKRTARQKISVINPNPTGVEGVEFQFNNGIYPNPADNEAYVQSVSPIQSVKIVDMNGAVIYFETFSGNMNKVRINTDNWKKGMYVVSVTTTKGRTLHKLIKI